MGFARLSESRSGRADGAKLETGREEKGTAAALETMLRRRGGRGGGRRASH